MVIIQTEKIILIALMTFLQDMKKCQNIWASDYLLRQVAQLHIPVIVSTDAHKAEELAMGRDEAVKHLKDLGIKYLMYIHNHQWEEYPIV